MARTWNIAVLPGDGIGSEVMAEGLKVLNAVAARLQGVAFALSEHPVGATEYLRHGNPLPESSFAACERADAILLGAMGLPSVRWPDGKEMTPQLDLRERLDLYNGVRPIRLYHELHSPLKHYRAGDIDLGTPVPAVERCRSYRRDAHHASRCRAHLPRCLAPRAATPPALHAGGQSQRAAFDGLLPRHL
jgi:hypothetical protein